MRPPPIDYTPELEALTQKIQILDEAIAVRQRAVVLAGRQVMYTSGAQMRAARHYFARQRDVLQQRLARRGQR